MSGDTALDPQPSAPVTAPRNVIVADDQTSAGDLPPRSGFRETMRSFLDLVPRGQRAPWAFLLGLSLVTAVAEMFGALLVFAIAGLFATDVDPSTLPVIGGLIDQLGGGNSDREILIVAGFVGVFYLFRGVLVLGEIYYQARVTQETGRRISVRLFRGYLSMPYPFFLQRNSAELIRTALNSVRQVVASFLTPGLRLISDSLASLGLLAVLILAAPWATALAFVVLTPTVYVMLRWVRPKLHRLGQRSEIENEVALRTLQHSLHGIREIKVTQTNQYFAGLFDRTRARLARIRYRLAVLTQAPRIVVETLVVLFIVILLVVTSIGPLADGESLAILGLFAYAALRMMPIVNRTTTNINKIRFGSASVDNVRYDLERVGAGAEAAPQQVSPYVLETAIELRDASFTYEKADVPALRNIDLVVEKGETLGIVGQTGSGKSTLLDLILSLLTPTTGVVLVDDEPIETRLPGWFASIGMVPQSVFLMDDTIRRNVAFGVSDRAIDDGRVDEALKLAQLKEFVDSLPEAGETVVGEHGIRLSGGQRQRIVIARAIYTDPSILILDEGTSALDSSTESELMEALENASRDRTVIIVAHRLSTVRQADRIVFLDEGKIVDIGRFDELLDRSEAFRGLAK